MTDLNRLNSLLEHILDVSTGDEPSSRRSSKIPSGGHRRSDLIIDPLSIIPIREAVVAFPVAESRVFDGHGRVGAMLRVIQAEEPMTEWWPITVFPPRIVALA